MNAKELIDRLDVTKCKCEWCGRYIDKDKLKLSPFKFCKYDRRECNRIHTKEAKKLYDKEVVKQWNIKRPPKK